jgi:anti-sigma factor ChrR (cupin superfamily)
MTLPDPTDGGEAILSRVAGKLVLRRLFDVVELARLKGWRAFRDGVDILPLYGNPQEGGQASAALLRYSPGAQVPQHAHPGFEHIIVLDGAQYDAHGSYGPGTCVISSPGTEHAVASEHGCIALAIWNQPVRFLQESLDRSHGNKEGTP